MSSDRMVFVNLPVRNLSSTIDFFRTLGFKFNPQFTDENAACMVISEDAFVMLLGDEFFKKFTRKGIADALKHTEVIVALSADSREEVDELVNKALAAGGKPASEPEDHGWMYGWSFQDLDGHLWGVVYMDEKAISPDGGQV